MRAGLVALHAERVGAGLRRQRGLGRAGHGDDHRAARVLEGPDHLGRGAAEGEAGDRGRVGQQGRDLAVEAVVVPAGVAEARAERVQVPGEPPASGYGVPGTKTLTPNGSAVAARTAAISAVIAAGVL